MTSRLEQNYRDAGFGAAIGTGRKQALLMIDFVRAYFEPGSPLYIGGPGPLPAACELLEAARQCGMMVIHTRVEYDAAGLSGGVFFRKVGALGQVFTPGAPLGQFMDGLEPRADEVVVTKQYASAFFGTSLASTLYAAGVDAVLIGGMSTSGCVRASAVDAMQHGFIPLVVRDAVGDRDAAPHEANLFDLAAKYADVLDWDAVMQLMGRQS